MVPAKSIGKSINNLSNPITLSIPSLPQNLLAASSLVKNKAET